MISYLYQYTIKFLPNEKIDLTFPMSDKFLAGLFHINTNKSVIHRSHATGDIIGSAHKCCKSQEKIEITKKKIFSLK